MGKRTAYQLRISLNDAAGNPVHQNVETIEVFPALKKSAAKVCAVGDKAAELAPQRARLRCRRSPGRR
ncbi:MAG: hypothetical protein ACLR8Y_08985 [Alistipes indistinctus]